MLYFLAPLAVFGVTFFLMPRRYQWAFMDGSMARARVIFGAVERIANGCIDFMLFTVGRFMGSAKVSLGSAKSAVSRRLESDEQHYLDDCQKYGDSLPAFSAETERNMRREGHWIGCMAKPRTLNGLSRTLDGLWEHHGAVGQAQRELNQAMRELNAAMYQPTAASQKELAKLGEHGN